MAITTEEFQSLYAAQSTRLLRIAFLIAGDLTTAEDAVAETFASCWRRWQHDRPDDAGAYLRRSLINELARTGRRDARRALHPVPQVGATDRPVEDALVLRRAVANLTPDRRVVIVLRYLEDLTESTVADILGVPVGTVKSRAARGLRDLESVLRATQEVSDG